MIMEKNQIQEALERLEEQLEGQPEEGQLNVISKELANLEQPLEDGDKLMLLDDDNSVGSKINKLKTKNRSGIYQLNSG